MSVVCVRTFECAATERAVRVLGGNVKATLRDIGSYDPAVRTRKRHSVGGVGRGRVRPLSLGRLRIWPFGRLAKM